MKIIIKYILKNMLEKKGRFLLLLFSISISAALLIMSLGVVDVIKDAYSGSMKAVTERQDICIISNADSVYFSDKDFDKSDIENIKKELKITGAINKDDEVNYVDIRGRKEFDGHLLEGEFKYENKPYCVVSKRIAEQKNLKINSKIKIAINGQNINFVVKGICADEGLFYNNKETQFAIVIPYCYLNNLLGAGSSYNYMTAQIKGKEQKKTIEKFNDENEKVTASKLYDATSINDRISTFSTALYIMLSIVVVISCIIIYGAFKLIITDRIVTIGTFMSLGATKKKIQNILFLESFLYGVFGAAIGIIMGEIGLIIVNYFISPLSKYGIHEKYQVRVEYIVAGAMFALILSIISAMFPIFRIRKFQIKDIILNRTPKVRNNGIVKFIIGLIFFIVGIVGFVGEGEWAINMSFISTIALFIGVIMIYPKLIEWIIKALTRLLKKSTISFLALNNIQSSKLLTGNISLITIALTSVLLIVSVGQSMENMVIEGYENLNYDYNIAHVINSSVEKSTTDGIINKLSKIDAVDKSSLNPYVTVSDSQLDNAEVFAIGVEPKEFADFNKYLDLRSEENAKAYKKFEESDGKSIVITKTLAKKIGKNIGDKVKLTVNDKTSKFEIVDVVDGKVYNNSIFVLINRDYMKSIYGVKEATSITFNVDGDIKNSEENIKKAIYDYGATYTLKSEDMKANISNNTLIIMALSVFSILAMLIATIGVFNNSLISFQQRKKAFAIMASVGMNSTKRCHLILIETIFSVIWSILISLPFITVLVNLFSKIMSFTGVPMVIKVAWNCVPQYCAMILVILVLASLSVIKKGKNLKVIEELKYE